MNKKRILIAIAVIIVVLIAIPHILFRFVDIEDIIVANTPNLDDDRWKTRESDYDGIEYTYIYMPGKKLATEDYIIYWKFKNKRDAKKVYKLLKENNYDVLEEEKNYFIGWEKGVCDAAVKEIVCIDGNTIVSTEIYIVSEWATTEDDDSPSYYDHSEQLQYVLDRYVH